jgi:hypothetical protein
MDRRPTAEHPSPWARFVFIIVILLQVGIPSSAAVLHTRQAHQWSWSMFSGFQIAYQFYLETPSGDVAVDPLEAGWFYGHVGYADAIPRRLCKRHPDAYAVRRQRYDRGNYYNPEGAVQIARFPCRA